MIDLCSNVVVFTRSFYSKVYRMISAFSPTLPSLPAVSKTCVGQLSNTLFASQDVVKFSAYSEEQSKAIEISKLSDAVYLELFANTKGKDYEEPAGSLPSGKIYSQKDLFGLDFNSEMLSRLASTWDVAFIDQIEEFYQCDDADLDEAIIIAVIQARHRIKGEEVRADRFGPL